MPGDIFRFLADDHARLDALLQRAGANPTAIDLSAYGEFRAGLLKHIGMEEKILLPAAQKRRGGEPLAVAAKLRLDHGALAALLVPTPTQAIVAAIRTILAAHNPIEEGPGGVYEECENVAGVEADQILRQLRDAPNVRAVPNFDGPNVIEATRRALTKAGYNLRL
ncbi:MAG: uncharacterized protein HW419_2962 [Deltaproteobacteria bacterium]|nr:uncharacterized protein [Deltaproteobacteria bacterium]